MRLRGAVSVAISQSGTQLGHHRNATAKIEAILLEPVAMIHRLYRSRVASGAILTARATYGRRRIVFAVSESLTDNFLR